MHTIMSMASKQTMTKRISGKTPERDNYIVIDFLLSVYLCRKCGALQDETEQSCEHTVDNVDVIFPVIYCPNACYLFIFCGFIKVSTSTMVSFLVYFKCVSKGW